MDVGQLRLLLAAGGDQNDEYLCKDGLDFVDAKIRSILYCFRSRVDFVRIRITFHKRNQIACRARSKIGDAEYLYFLAYLRGGSADIDGT